MGDLSPLIVGLGVCCEDRIGLTPHWPGPDEGVHLRQVVRQCGGMAATSLAAAAQVGIPVAYIGMAGADASGRWLKRQLEKQGVDCRQMILRKGFTTPVSQVIVQQRSGHRRIFHYRPKPFDLSIEEIDFSVLDHARFLHLDGHHLNAAVEAARYARRIGVRVCLDASFPYPGLERLLPLVDYLICNRHFPQRFTGNKNLRSALESLAEYGSRMTAATLGAKGVLWRSRGKFETQPAFPVEVVDTTGAGDVFHGAFLAALCKGMQVRSAVRYAAAAASLSCRALGGQGALPGHEEVAELLRRKDYNQYPTR